MRSRPSAMPPCGGVPYSSASTKKPKRSFASSSEMPSSLKIERLQRLVVDTDAAAADLAAVEHEVVGARARTSPGRSRADARSLSSGAVNGWCMNSQRCSSALPLEHREVDDPEELEAVRDRAGSPSSRRSAAAGRAASRSARRGPAAITSRSAGAGAGELERLRGSPSSPAAFSAELCTRPPGARAHTRPAAPSCLACSTSSSSSRREYFARVRDRRTRGRRRPPRARSRKTRERRLREGRRQVLDLHPEAAGPACRIRTSRSPRRTACGGTAAAPRGR